jgi:hypothetical protein
MPPVTKAGGSAFRKDVEFVATKDSDEYELEAAGIVMVPSKADLQNDFAREDTIRAFAEQFETFAEAGQASGGIMHAVWPDGWMDLTRNEVLDESEDIGGQTVDAGAWVQRWGITNTELAELIDEDILSGYSIGAIQVDWDGPFEPEEVDDVDTSEIPDDEMVWELVDGIIREVSAVDIPAVPDAQILEAKADVTKRLAEHVGNQDAFIEEAMERGHTEAEAERLWDVLNEAVEEDGAAQPGKQSRLAQAAKAFLSALTGDEAGASTAETPVQDPRGTDEHTAGDDDEAGESTDKDAPEGDTSDATDMSNDNTDDGGGDKSLAEQNAEQIKELTQAVEQQSEAVTELTETLAGPRPKTAEIEIGGETYEVPEEQVKSALGVDEDAGVDVADAIESLKSEVEAQGRRIDAIGKQSGAGATSQQVRENSDDGDDEGGLEGLGKALS